MTDELIEECVALGMRAYAHGTGALSTSRSPAPLTRQIADVVVDAMTGGDRTLRAQLFRAQFGAVLVAGALYIVTPRDAETVLAVAIWFGPGTTMMGT